MSDTLIPNDEKQLSEIIQKANADKTSLRIEGGGTRQGLGNIVKSNNILSLKKLSGISLYEPGALTLVVKAGTKYKDVEKILKAEGQRLAFEPIDHRKIYSSTGDPSIGAIVAGNFSGPRRIQSGSCRDALIGVRFVSGTGEIIKNGGRVMKNVTGLDLVKLMAGSFGTLGAISEVAFKSQPVPERQATLEIAGLQTSEAVSLMAKALGSPFEISGAAHLSKDKNQARTLLRIEGFDSQVSYRLKKLQETIARAYDCETIAGVKHDKLWRTIRDVEIFAGTKNPVWKISVKPSDAPIIEAQLKDKTGAKLMFDWGGGLVWAQMPNEDNAHQDAVRHIVRETGGHATLIRASDVIRDKADCFQPQAVGVAKLSSCIKQKFDPAGILNPSLMQRMRG